MGSDILAQLSDLGSELIQLVRSGIGLATDYAPVVVSELLRWKMASAIIGLFIGIIFIIIAIIGIKFLLYSRKIGSYDQYSYGEREKLEKLFWRDYDTTYEISGVIMIIVGCAIGLIVFGLSLGTIIKIVYAPTIFVIDQLKLLFM